MTIYLTTPIYYVNAEPHIGHAYTTVVADALARFHRLLGEEVRFQTGTDEHGDKVVEAAAAAGPAGQGLRGPNQRPLPPVLGRPGYQLRPLHPHHRPGPHARWCRRSCNGCTTPGDIYFGEYGGLYCFGCECFYLERDLVDGLCPDHKTAPTYLKEENYFFRMSKYQDWLMDYIQTTPTGSGRNATRTRSWPFCKEPLEDLCISRPKSRMDWGITLPFDDRYVTYVWFDALLNYLSGLGYPNGADYQKFWPAQHLIAKDILKPHAIYWPTMLRAMGLAPFRQPQCPRLLADGRRQDVQEPGQRGGAPGPGGPLRRGPGALLLPPGDGLRAGRPLQRGGPHRPDQSDLANDLGNLFARSLGMAFKYRQGVVPAPGELTALDQEVVSLVGPWPRTFSGFSRPWSSPGPWPACGSSSATSTATSSPRPPGNWPNTRRPPPPGYGPLSPAGRTALDRGAAPAGHARQRHEDEGATGPGAGF